MKKITALMAISSLALAACGSSSSDDTGTVVSAKPSTSSSSGGYGGAYGSSSSKTTAKTTVSNSSGKSTEVEMYDNYFKPKTITGAPGSTVKVELKNEGNTEHNFKIDGQKADADVEAGEDSSVSVVIPKSGSVQFYCEYHKGLGMVGTVKAS